MKPGVSQVELVSQKSSVSDLSRQPSQGGAAAAAAAAAGDGPKQVTADDLKRIGREFFAYLAFLIIFTVATVLARGNHSAFYLVDRLKTTLFNKEIDDGRTFWEVTSVSDIWDFAEGPLVNGLLLDEFDGGQALPESLRYYPNLHNKLLGGIRLRQLRVKEHSCKIDPRYEDDLSQCYDEFSEDDEQKSAFQPSDELYKWTSESANDEIGWFGQFGLYPGSGYTVDLPADREGALSRLGELREDRWIRNGTRLVLMDFVTYNPGVNLHAFCRMAFEVPASGGVRPRADFVALKLNRYFGTEGKTQLGLEIVFLIFLAYYVIVEIVEMFREGCGSYIRDVWNWLDWINILLFIIAIGIRAASIQNFKDVDPVTSDKYESIRMAVDLFSAESYVTSINAFLLWIKMFKYFTFSKRIQFLYRTFQVASTDLFFFLILFVIFFIGFAHAGYMAFSGDVAEFRSFGVSIVTLFRAVIGEMDYETLENSNRVFGPMYFIVFQICVLLILLNVFLAILADAYSFVREQDQEGGADEMDQFRDLFAGIKDKITGVLHLKSGDADRAAHGMRFADKDNDNMVSLEELTDMLTDQGIPNPAAKAKQLMAEYDADGTGFLERDEVEHLQQTLVARAEMDDAMATAGAVGAAMANSEAIDRIESRLQNLEELLNQLLQKE